MLDPFSRRGILEMGYEGEIVGYGGTPTDMVGDGTFVLGQGGMWFIDTDGECWEWDDGSEVFDGTSVFVGTSGGQTVDLNSVAGDADRLYAIIEGTDLVRVRSAGGSWSTLNDQCDISDGTLVTEYGDYLYIWNPTNGEIFEILKATANTSTTETPLHYVAPNGNFDTDRKLLVAGDNRIYAVAYNDEKTMIHEIVPTSAAGTGYGSEMATIYGVVPESAFYVGGTLYLFAIDDESGLNDNYLNNRQLFYIDPQGAYGTLGPVRGFTDGSVGPGFYPPVPASGRLAMGAFLAPAVYDSVGASTEKLSLFEVDLITGGMACVAGDEGLLSSTAAPTSLVYYKGHYYGANEDKIIRWRIKSVTNEQAFAVSPWNDFAIGNEKILEAIEIQCDPLPASTSITVGYKTDNGSWTDLTTLDTDGSTGTKISVSTDSSTVTFRNLQVRVKLDSSGSQGPVLRSVDVYARSNRRMRIWDLLLDASDDAAPQGYNGAKIIDNIVAIGENTVVDFIDNYQTHNAEAAQEQIDVVLDSAVLDLTQPGEGTIQVRLLEVI